MSRLKKAAKKVPVIDPYLPHNGNFGYRVSRYELDLEYKVAINRLAGSATITAVTLAELQTFTLDLSNALTVTKVSVNGRRPAAFSCSSGKLRIALSSTLPAGAGDDHRGPLWRHAATRPVPVGRGRFRGVDRGRAGGGAAQRRGIVVSV